MTATKQEAEAFYLDELFEQDEWWITKNGYIRVAEMDLMHRRRTAMMLLRGARFYAAQILATRDVEPRANEVMEFLSAPQDWLKATPLYQAIVKDGADPDAFWTDDTTPRHSANGGRPSL